ncbi:MAG: hypothetical protein LBV35_18920 [Acinetobacter sp.]|jgi:hypothetical protein|uniref:hypothetical protein n=1 Tax=Acinetobacter sp. TaxID=472 RepID=UPI00283CE36F|nr:hypothetical protein [Acinetobacter sp.]MDR3030517.1 hypothetical protein [Acinetobacter sp.]
MKKLALLIATITAMTSSVSTIAETVEQADVYQQAYALYMLYHSNNKDQTTPSLIKQYPQDYAELFKGNKKVTQQQFVQFEQARLEPLLKQRREMSEKQAHIRFGILDNNKDQKLTLKEFQETGLKTFNQFDKNQDGLINAEDAKLSDNTNATHDGFRVKLPISMPMPSNTQEFITQYGQGKNYVTLGDYLTARDKQYIANDANGDHIVTEKEYVDEFMQRFDQNIASGKLKMQETAGQQFQAISKGKTTIQHADLQQFAKKLNQSIRQ